MKKQQLVIGKNAVQCGGCSRIVRRRKIDGRLSWHRRGRIGGGKWCRGGVA
jgi:hypothetical protein